MNNTKFEQMREDFLTAYEDDLCEESIIDVKSAPDADAFVEHLHKYVLYTKYKRIPSTQWVRKWFANERELTNAHGIFIDQVVELKDPAFCGIIAYGNSVVNFNPVEPRNYTLTMFDTTILNIIACSAVCVSVRKKDRARVNVLKQNMYSRIKIREV